jgi:hypothetical protein
LDTRALPLLPPRPSKESLPLIPTPAFVIFLSSSTRVSFFLSLSFFFSFGDSHFGPQNLPNYLRSRRRKGKTSFLGCCQSPEKVPSFVSKKKTQLHCVN